MIVSEITVNDLCNQARIEATALNDAEREYLDNLLCAAKSYAAGYTGLSIEQLDEHEDISIAVLAIAADMYDNRTLSADKSNVNRTVETILGMHSVNLL